MSGILRGMVNFRGPDCVSPPPSVLNKYISCNHAGLFLVELVFEDELLSLLDHALFCHLENLRFLNVGKLDLRKVLSLGTMFLPP